MGHIPLIAMVEMQEITVSCKNTSKAPACIMSVFILLTETSHVAMPQLKNEEKLSSNIAKR